jgi:site-specific recombinase XerD
VAEFAQHFGKSPDKLGPDDLRRYQAYLLQERKLTVGTVIARVAALRFFFVRTLKRHQFRQDLPYPKEHRRLPTVLSSRRGLCSVRESGAYRLTVMLV